MKSLSVILTEHARAAFDLGEAQAKNLSVTDPEAMTRAVKRYEAALAALDHALGRPPTVPMTAPLSPPKITPLPSPRKEAESE